MYTKFDIYYRPLWIKFIPILIKKINWFTMYKMDRIDINCNMCDKKLEVHSDFLDNYKTNKVTYVKFNSYDIDDYSCENIKFVDFDVDFLIQKKSFLNIFLENLQFYSYRLINYTFYDIIYKDDVNVHYKVFFYQTLVPDSLCYFLTVVFDKLYLLLLFSLPFFNYFLKNFFNYSEFNILILNNPEYFFIFEQNLFKYFKLYFSNIYPSIFLLNVDESFLTPIFSILQFFSIFFFLTFYIFLYFTYFNTMYKEENTLDHDYLAVNVTIEAEEELGSIDDILMSLVILVFLFLWFFWINGWIAFGNYNIFIMSIFLFPMLYFIIFLIPLNLLYDYGNYFLPYLNGVGKSVVLLIELLFDYIATSIFFLRLIVQNVRLIFMIFTYTELHELVVFYSFSSNFVVANESLLTSWQYIKNISNSGSYSFIFEYFSKVVKWLYELFHTFFMIIFQFIAFFAMVFWLFLFLYTMFAVEKHEAYLFDLKIQRVEFYKKLLNYKNNSNNILSENLNYIYNNIQFYLNKRKFKSF